MATKQELEIAEIIRVCRLTSRKDFESIEGISTGSAHKTKEEILRAACDRARSGKRYLQTILNCLDALNSGANFKDWIDIQLDNINRTNQCEQDRLDDIEDLNRLSEEAINID